MKKVLIVSNSFGTGGIQSAMVNMANELSKHCQVDLFVYNPQGPMKERLHKNVRILPVSWRFRAIGMTPRQVVQSKDLRMIAYRFFMLFWTKLFTNRGQINHAIRHQEKMLGYDVAIAYHQEQRKRAVLCGFTRVVDQLTDAKVKLAWIHFDSAVLDLDNAYNEPFYHRMDKIVCVSRSTMESFRNANPTLADKVDYCYNFMDYDRIVSQSVLPMEYPYPENGFICFSACRLSREKALVRAVKALAPVFRKHLDIFWYIAGSGEEQTAIKQAVKEETLDGRIVLIGNQSNPYAYMKKSNLVMNVSYHEAAPMVFLEARALKKPVFATKTVSASEFLNDNVDAFLCENTEEGMYGRFADLMEHRAQVCQAEKNMQGMSFCNQESLNKILSWI